MSVLFMSLLLVVIINLPVVLRTFVHSHIHNAKQTDYFTILPFISLCICIFLIYVHGLMWSIFGALVITLIILFTNIGRFYKFCIHLKKTSFSPGFVAISAIETVLLLGYMCVLFVFFPSFINVDISKKIVYMGDAKSGYVEKGTELARTTAKVLIYRDAHNDFGFDKKASDNENSALTETAEVAETTEATETIQVAEATELAETTEAAEQKPAVLFISDIFADETDSVGTLAYLADKGYAVYSMTFYDRKLSYFDDVRDVNFISKAALRNENKTNKDGFAEKYDKIVKFNYDKYDSAVLIMTELGIDQFYILADGYCIPAAEQLAEVYPDKIVNIYKINSDNEIPGYVDGYGNFSATKPLEWAILGYKMNRRWDDAKRIAFFANKKFTKTE
ncbi:MAG: hypothetical protein K6G52_02355 [Treponemataceae bacterium]|nr:hypothetical protein [Treponemataceae bacterium]